MLLIRDEFLAITFGNHCAAAILADMEYWTNWKLDDIERKLKRMLDVGADTATLEREPWLYKSAKMFSEDLLYLYKEDTILKALKQLRERGYILRRRNPRYGWDRTYQYKLEITRVQEAIATAPSYSKNLKNQVHKPEKSGAKTGQVGFMDAENQAHEPDKSDMQSRKISSIDPINRQAIPEITSEITAKITERPSTESDVDVADDARRAELAKLLTRYRISRTEFTAEVFDHPTLTAEEAERVIKEVNYQARHGEVRNASGLIIYKLLHDDIPPAPPKPAPRVYREPEPPAPPLPPEEKLWQTVLNELETQMPRATFNIWLKHTHVEKYEGDTFTISVHDASAVEWIENRLLTTIKRTLTNIAGAETEIKFVSNGGQDESHHDRE